jgi:hypothetical protein
MDDASEGNIRSLREAGSAYVRENMERLEGIVEFLYDNAMCDNAICDNASVKSRRDDSLVEKRASKQIKVPEGRHFNT